MQIPIPQEFKQNLNNFTKQVLDNGFQLIDKKKYLQNITYSILLQFNKSINEKLDSILRSKIPSEILKKIYIQPYEGFHITLQSTQIPTEEIKKDILKDLKEYVQDIFPFETSIIGPYPSHKNLFFAVTTNKNIANIRKDIEDIYLKYRLESHLPFNNNLMWVSVCRFIQQLDEREQDFILHKIEQESLNHKPIDRIVITENNPIFSEKSKILGIHTF